MERERERMCVGGGGGGGVIIQIVYLIIISFLTSLDSHVIEIFCVVVCLLCEGGWPNFHLHYVLWL